MDKGYGLYREIARWEMEREREDISLRRSIRAARISSGGRVSFKSRISRFLMRTAFAIDPEEGWQHFRVQLHRGATARNSDL